VARYHLAPSIPLADIMPIWVDTDTCPVAIKTARPVLPPGPSPTQDTPAKHAR
jgi:hypothetical protein